MFLPLLKESFVLTMIISGIPLVASAMVGVCVSLFQASTQIQDQTLGFLLKFLAERKHRDQTECAEETE